MRLLSVLLFAATLTAQQLPQHFTGAGLGFQNSAIPKASGFYTACESVGAGLYGCLSMDYAGGTTSTRGEAHQLLKQFGRCGIFGTGGAGAATGASGGVGGSFDAGGVIACEIPQRLARQRGFYATFSGSWQKNNVVQAPDIGTVLRAFGQQTIWRFGFGKGW